MICPKRNKERMGDHLSKAELAHPREIIVMVIDGASSHVAKNLVVPENIRLLRLPAYALELNPQEHVWDEVREKEFANRGLNKSRNLLRMEWASGGLPHQGGGENSTRTPTLHRATIAQQRVRMEGWRQRRLV